MGVAINENQTKLYQTNYDYNDGNFDIDRWFSYQFRLNDRIRVIKMNILPQLLNLFSSVPIEAPKIKLQKWDELISKLVFIQLLLTYLNIQFPRSFQILYLGHLKGNAHPKDEYLFKILLVAAKKTN